MIDKKLYLNAGQMKSGTTFLYGILRNHPELYFSYEKEIHYLSNRYGRFHPLTDYNRLRSAKSFLHPERVENDNSIELQRKLSWVESYLKKPDDWQWYLDLFKGAKTDQYIVDFSNLTCTIDPNGLKEINKKFISTKVTYCMRDSVDRVFSHLKFHLKAAKSSKNIMDMNNDEIKKMILSDNIKPQSEVGVHVNNLIGAFGEENVRLIKCEDMWADAQKTINEICNFLKIKDFYVSSEKFSKVNAGPKAELDTRIRGLIEEVLCEDIAIERKVKERYRELFIS